MMKFSFILIFVILSSIAYAISSDNYRNNIVISGGAERISSPNYLTDTYISQTSTGIIISSTFENRIGFFHFSLLDLTPPNITISNPRNNSQLIDTPIYILFNITDDQNITQCSYNIQRSNGSFIISNTTLSNCKGFTTFVTLPDDIYILNVFATDSFNNFAHSFITFTKTIVQTQGGGGGRIGTICLHGQFLLDGRCINDEFKPIVEWILSQKQPGVLEYNLRASSQRVAQGKILFLTNKFTNEGDEDLEIVCTNFLDTNKNGILDRDSESYIAFSKEVLRGTPQNGYNSTLLYDVILPVPKNTKSGQYQALGMCEYTNKNLKPAWAFTFVDVSIFPFSLELMVIGLLFILILIFFFRRKNKNADT